MLDFTEQVHSIESPPVSSPDTPIASDNLPGTDLPFVDGDGSNVIAMNYILPKASDIENFDSNDEGTRLFFQDEDLMDEDWDALDLDTDPPWVEDED